MLQIPKVWQTHLMRFTELISLYSMVAVKCMNGGKLKP
jgi:hypothetical protein